MMESMFRWLVGLFVVFLVALGIAFLIAGRGTPPQLIISKPDRFVGQTGLLDVTVEAPGARFLTLSISLEQNGRSTSLFTLGAGGVR